MKLNKQKPSAFSQAGFSLVELAIVLGVITAIIGGIWSYTTSVQQSSEVEQSVEAISLVADATRTAYSGSAGITGGISIVVPQLLSEGAMPTYLLRNFQTSCNGSAKLTYADSPFGINTTTNSSDTCGTLRVCAWQWVQGQNACNTNSTPTIAQPYFAIEFSDLDFKSCVSLVERVTPTQPTTGLKDVFINSGISNANALPVSPSTALTDCKPTSPATTVTVDFVYSLRAPSS